MNRNIKMCLAAFVLCGVAWAEVRVPDFDPPEPVGGSGKPGPAPDTLEVRLPAGLPPTPWFRDEAGLACDSQWLCCEYRG